MGLERLLGEHKAEIVCRWRARVGRKLGGGAVDGGALDDGAARLLDAVAARLAGDEPVAAPDAGTYGAERLRLGFDASELVRETGALHCAVLAVAAEHGEVLDADEALLLARSFYVTLATAIGEHARRRDAEVEREVVEQLRGLAGALDGSARDETLARLHEWSLSQGAWPVAGAARRARFSLAAVLAEAVGALRDVAAERAVPVLVDLATPIDVDGDRDLLRRAIVRVVRCAIAATRSGGSVVVRAQMLSGGRVRIDVRDECGGRGKAPAGHFVRPALALGGARAAVDWSIVRRAIAANDGTVHARKLPGVGCLVTIDVPGRGEVDPCCDGAGDGEGGGDAPARRPAAQPSSRGVALRDRAAAAAEQLRRCVDARLLDEAPPRLRSELVALAGALAVRAHDERIVARAESALVALYRNVTARTTSSCVSTLSKRT